MAVYFECVGCGAVTVRGETLPKCSNCGSGWGLVRSNIREAGEKIIGVAAPKNERAPKDLPMERRKN